MFLYSTDFKHQQQFSADEHSHPTLVANMYTSKLSGLSDLFLQALRNMIDRFDQIPNALERVKSILSTLVLPLGDGKVAALVDPNAYKDAHTLRELMRRMAPYWNCFSTDLLQLLSEELSCSLATATMDELVHARQMKDLVLAVNTASSTSEMNDVDSGLSLGHKSAHSAPLEELQCQHPAVFARLPEHRVSASRSVARISVEVGVPALHLMDYYSIVQAVSAFFKLPCAALVYCGCSQSPLVVCWEISTELIKYITSVLYGNSGYRLLAEQKITGLAVADKIKYRCPSIKVCKLVVVTLFTITNNMMVYYLVSTVDGIFSWNDRPMHKLLKQ